MTRRYPNQTAKPGLWSKLKPEGQRMRRKPMAAVERLWELLRDGRLGVRFRRQHAIDRFIVDFISLSAKLIVEVDGPIHEGRAEMDAERDAILTSAGFRVVRYRNEHVLRDTNAVIADLKRCLGEM